LALLLRWLIALAAALTAALALGAAAWAQDVLPVPALTARVLDQTGTLSAEQRSALEGKLAAFESSHGAQIAVLIVASTAPEELADYTQRVGDTWKLGRADVGDGVLVVVALEQRRVRIAVAKALQGAIPDLAARQIIEQQIRPAFRQGDYAGGLNAALDRIFARITSEGLPAPAARAQAQQGFQLEELAMFFFVAVPIVGAVLTGIFGRKLGSLFTAAGASGIGWWFSASLLVALGAGIAALVLVGLLGIGSAARRLGSRGRSLPHIGGWGGGGGWSGGGGGGGGFSSGGGGDFDGGGASGDW
jgi:uncharacterized protein